MLEYDNPWIYDGSPVYEFPDDAYAFVYILTHKASGRSYIGKKTLWSARTKTVKGKKKRYKVESDWKKYYSSSEEIKKMVSEGEEFSREILHLCVSKGQANYLEAREQMDRRVLENPDKYMNGIINCRVHWSHVKMDKTVTF